MPSFVGFVEVGGTFDAFIIRHIFRNTAPTNNLFVCVGLFYWHAVDVLADAF
jgi:hypothetical protein